MEIKIRFPPFRRADSPIRLRKVSAHPEMRARDSNLKDLLKQRVAIEFGFERGFKTERWHTCGPGAWNRQNTPRSWHHEDPPSGGVGNIEGFQSRLDETDHPRVGTSQNPHTLPVAALTDAPRTGRKRRTPDPSAPIRKSLRLSAEQSAPGRGTDAPGPPKVQFREPPMSRSLCWARDGVVLGCSVRHHVADAEYRADPQTQLQP